MNKNEAPLNKEGCHWGSSISQSKAQSLSVSVDMDTNKMQLKLRAIAKHAEALADELDAIDNAWLCECGSDYYREEVTKADGQVYQIERTCYQCGAVYLMPLESDD